VKRHIAEIPGEHRVAAALFNILELSLMEVMRAHGLGHSINERSELEIDTFRGIFLDRLGRTSPDRCLLSAVVLEQTDRREIRRSGASRVD
jgi:hypothetical protein